MADLKPVYKKINGDWVKQTAYERQSGEWVRISAGKEPVAYLYNGVQLPPLPEWDKETYPYAAIAGDMDSYTETFGYRSSRVFLVSTEPFYVQDMGTSTIALYLCDLLGCPAWYNTTEASGENDNVWSRGQYELYTENERRVLWYNEKYDVHSFAWANHDIINKNDNTVWCVSSDPIPVYGIKE